MSLIGIDVRTFSDMDTLHQKHGIGLFQIAAKTVTKYVESQIKASLSPLIIAPYKIAVHYSYSINLSNRWSATDWWIQQMISEVREAELIGAYAIVIHTGKSIDFVPSVAINNMYSALLYVHSQTSDTKVKLLIETPAGQGTEILSEVEHFIKFMRKFEHVQNIDNTNIESRFGICIDTCHVYSAGYDISQTAGIEKFFKLFNDSIGINKIKLVHLNNTRGGLGSKIDRHANLDDGVLSMESIKLIVRFVNHLEIPMCLETETGPDYEFILKDYEIIKRAIMAG